MPGPVLPRRWKIQKYQFRVTYSVTLPTTRAHSLGKHQNFFVNAKKPRSECWSSLMVACGLGGKDVEALGVRVPVVVFADLDVADAVGGGTGAAAAVVEEDIGCDENFGKW